MSGPCPTCATDLTQMRLIVDRMMAQAQLLTANAQTAADTVATLADAWRGLRLDTQEDQRLHEHLLRTTDVAVQQLRGGL